MVGRSSTYLRRSCTSAPPAGWPFLGRSALTARWLRTARASGIRVERVTWIVYIVGGALAALAGLLLTGRLDSVLSGQGQNMIFTVFAAAVIGGIRLNGGPGTMVGASRGVVLLGVISNILTLSQIPDFWINAAFGGIILAALLLAKFTSGAS